MKRLLADLPARPDVEGHVKCSEEQLALVDFAVKAVKKAGFVFVYSSVKSEACYYRLGDREGSLRVAAHRFGHRSEGRLLSFPVWSCLTFPNHQIRSAEAALSMIDIAVGRYIMYPHTRLETARRHMHPVSHLFETETRTRRP